MLPVIALAVAAAGCLGAAAVVMHRAAASEPVRGLGRTLLRRLCGRRLWVGGVALLVAGTALQATALSLGRLTVVEPVTTVSLLVGLPLSAWWLHQRLSRVDWLAVAATVGGLGLFLGVGRPYGGHSQASLASSLAATGVVAGLAVLLGVVLRYRGDSGRATALALAAGAGAGLTDMLIRGTVQAAVHDHFAVLGTWHPWLLAAVGLSAFVIQQHAYHAGHLSESMPAAATAQPIAGCLLGLTVLQERLDVGGLEGAAFGTAALLMAAGVIHLARSPLIVGVEALRPSLTSWPSS